MIVSVNGKRETVVLAKPEVVLKFHPPSPALEWRVRLSLTWSRRTVDPAPDPLWLKFVLLWGILEYQEFHLGVFSLGSWAGCVLCTLGGRISEEVERKHWACSAEAGVEGQIGYHDPEGSILMVIRLFSSSLPPRAAILPALGPLSHSLTLNLKQSFVSFCPITLCPF